MKELNKDKIKVTRPVYLYLVKNKIYKQFVDNCKEYQLQCIAENKLYHLNINRRITKSTKFPSKAIMNGFNWDLSEEGFNFWRDKYTKAKKIENGQFNR